MILMMLLMLAGTLIYGLILLNKAYKKPTFKWSVFWKQNAISLILNVVIGAVIVVAIHSYNPNFTIKAEGYDLTGFVFAVIGFAAQPIWQVVVDYLGKLFGKFKGESKTYLKRDNVK
jgi:hypothetical protein